VSLSDLKEYLVGMKVDSSDVPLGYCLIHAAMILDAARPSSE